MHHQHVNHGEVRSRRLPQSIDRAKNVPSDEARRGSIPGAKLNSLNSGLVLLDAMLAPLYLSAEAERVLSIYASASGDDLNEPVADLTQQILDSGHPENGMEIRSGRRRYSLRVVVLDAGARPPQPAFALLLERPVTTRRALRQAAEHFSLTKREAECLELLAHGLTTKDIALRLRISPDTAKCFLRQIMSKTGAKTRAGILGKFLEHLAQKNSPAA